MKHLQQYLDYIRNTGQVPLPISAFDDDWEPIGEMVRRDLLAARLIYQTSAGIAIREPSHGTK